MSEVVQIVIRLVIILVLLLITGVLSVSMFYRAYENHKKRKFIRDTPISKIRSMAVGPVLVKGEAKKIDEDNLIDHPVLDRKCLAYKVMKKKDDSNNQATDIERKSCNFKVEDETGEVDVYTDEETIPSNGGNGWGDRKIKLQTKKHGINEENQGDEFIWKNTHISAIFPGSEVLVLGEAEVNNRIENPSSENENNLCLKRPRDYPLLISNHEDKDNLIEETMEDRVSNLLIGGTFFGFVSVILFLPLIYYSWILYMLLLFS